MVSKKDEPPGNGLDEDAFPAFRDLLRALADYTKLTGFRYDPRDFQDPSNCDPAVSSIVKDYQRRLVTGSDPELWRQAVNAVRCAEQEGIRTVMMATCRDLGVWPQNVDASEKSSMAWQDTSEPLDKIALALYNQQHNVADSEGYQAVSRTASFISDFVYATVGSEKPELHQGEKSKLMLTAFLNRVKEYQAQREVDIGRQEPETYKRIRGTVLSAMEGWAPPSLVAYIGDWTSDNFPSPTTAALLGFGVVAAATAIGVAAAMSRSKKNKERRHD
ncbi:hypothetical protein Pmar_PMAR001046 [Perkinsus marinus ATCC 50983]|uniref:Uncharacterized protein n=1 Tax=Perkinsus marinus (strain ATCC 50983 / TXsc) TaxID=423536 RepID=C5KTE4_PERM5|nr:hypothetical protein Pmar_PMAR001046 [Perkinsus marinus ATCC 50983]EER12249.1 hypothetical protein Pmar_PMAR001046 [Perkinsus marinus ATCC 50983]|eukprot:XP_002780454.1 hypothetical protein Pmar_PMAR001046 [Perkinsus marinus ATCC 50983]